MQNSGHNTHNTSIFDSSHPRPSRHQPPSYLERLDFEVSQSQEIDLHDLDHLDTQSENDQDFLDTTKHAEINLNSNLRSKSSPSGQEMDREQNYQNLPNQILSKSCMKISTVPTPVNNRCFSYVNSNKNTQPLDVESILKSLPLNSSSNANNSSRRQKQAQSYTQKLINRQNRLWRLPKNFTAKPFFKTTESVDSGDHGKLPSPTAVAVNQNQNLFTPTPLVLPNNSNHRTTVHSDLLKTDIESQNSDPNHSLTNEHEHEQEAEETDSQNQRLLDKYVFSKIFNKNSENSHYRDHRRNSWWDDQISTSLEPNFGTSKVRDRVNQINQSNQINGNNGNSSYPIKMTRFDENVKIKSQSSSNISIESRRLSIADQTQNKRLSRSEPNLEEYEMHEYGPDNYIDYTHNRNEYENKVYSQLALADFAPPGSSLFSPENQPLEQEHHDPHENSQLQIQSHYSHTRTRSRSNSKDKIQNYISHSPEIDVDSNDFDDHQEKNELVVDYEKSERVSERLEPLQVDLEADRGREDYQIQVQNVNQNVSQNNRPHESSIHLYTEEFEHEHEIQEFREANQNQNHTTPFTENNTTHNNTNTHDDIQKFLNQDFNNYSYNSWNEQKGKLNNEVKNILFTEFRRSEQEYEGQEYEEQEYEEQEEVNEQNETNIQEIIKDNLELENKNKKYRHELDEENQITDVDNNFVDSRVITPRNFFRFKESFRLREGFLFLKY